MAPFHALPSAANCPTAEWDRVKPYQCFLPRACSTTSSQVPRFKHLQHPHITKSSKNSCYKFSPKIKPISMITHGHVFFPVNSTRGLLASSDNAIDCCKILCAVKGATFSFWLHRSKCSAVGLSPLTGHQLVKEAGGQHRDCD